MDNKIKKQPKDYAKITWHEPHGNMGNDLALYIAFVAVACLFGFAFYGAFLT